MRFSESSLASFSRRQYAAVLGSLAAHVEVAIRFESNFANGALGSFLVPVVSGHHAHRKRPVLRKNDTGVRPHTFQFSRLVSYLNAIGEIARDITLFQRR